jgi:hypothetical protein
VVVSTSPNPQAWGPPLVGCPRLLIQFIHSYPPYRRPFLHPQPEDAPRRGDRDPHSYYTDKINKFKKWSYSSRAFRSTLLSPYPPQHCVPCRLHLSERNVEACYVTLRACECNSQPWVAAEVLLVFIQSLQANTGAFLLNRPRSTTSTSFQTSVPATRHHTKPHTTWSVAIFTARSNFHIPYSQISTLVPTGAHIWSSGTLTSSNS